MERNSCHVENESTHYSLFSFDVCLEFLSKFGEAKNGQIPCIFAEVKMHRYH